MTEKAHGVLVSVADAGVLIVGEAGVGKSECALELITRGHRLVADDVVIIERSGDALVGRPPERFEGLLEIRDLGIFDVRQLFGDGSFVPTHTIELCVELRESKDGDQTVRIGAKQAELEILGVKIPKFVLSVGGARNLPVLLETAVRLFQSDWPGAERDLIAAHDAAVVHVGATAP